MITVKKVFKMVCVCMCECEGAGGREGRKEGRIHVWKNILKVIIFLLFCVQQDILFIEQTLALYIELTQAISYYKKCI